MPRLRYLSGYETIGILRQFGSHPLTQRGSHTKLRRIARDVAAQTLTVPRHRQLVLGTLRAIIRQASRFIPKWELREVFYTD